MKTVILLAIAILFSSIVFAQEFHYQNELLSSASETQSLSYSKQNDLEHFSVASAHFKNGNPAIIFYFMLSKTVESHPLKIASMMLRSESGGSIILKHPFSDTFFGTKANTLSAAVLYELDANEIIFLKTKSIKNIIIPFENVVGGMTLDIRKKSALNIKELVLSSY